MRTWLSALGVTLLFAFGPAAAADGVRGIDVSHYQGEIDWPAVKAAGIAFAYAKATEGVKEVDSKFHRNWKEMKAAGVLRGAYVFYRFGDDVAKQAKMFAETVKLESGDLPPMIDVETANGDVDPASGLAKELKAFIAAVEKELGARSVLYTSNAFWDKHMTGDFDHHPLWVAEYQVKAPRLPNGWSEWTIWQHSQKGEIDGITGTVDLNLLNGDAASLDALRMK